MVKNEFINYIKSNNEGRKKENLNETPCQNGTSSYSQGMGRVGAGLKNMGNTCFLNSTLQCLMHTSPLFSFLRSQTHGNSCLSQSFCMICELKKLVNNSFNNGSSIVKPQGILQNLKFIAHHMKWGRQEDAHEFLRYVIESIHKSSNIQKSQNEVNISIAHKIFQGLLKSQIKCLNCHHISVKLDPFLDVCIDVKNIPSIVKGLQKFTAPETLHGENAYMCGNCKKKVKADKMFLLHRLPHIFTLQLKRYSPFGGKVSSHVSFPELLNLNPYMSNESVNKESSLYKLYAVLVHEGNSTSSGHYYCYVRGPKSKWFCMNDSYVSQINLQNVLQSQAYILFYEQERKNDLNKLYESPKKDPNTDVIKRLSLDPTSVIPLSVPTPCALKRSKSLSALNDVGNKKVRKHNPEGANDRQVNENITKSNSQQEPSTLLNGSITSCHASPQPTLSNDSPTSLCHSSVCNSVARLNNVDHSVNVLNQNGNSIPKIENGSVSNFNGVKTDKYTKVLKTKFIDFTSRWKVKTMKKHWKNLKGEMCRSTSTWKVENATLSIDETFNSPLEAKCIKNSTINNCPTFDWDSKVKPTVVENETRKDLLEELAKKRLAYGCPISTWDGEKSHLDKMDEEMGIYSKKRKTDLDEELDRGRVKKLRKKSADKNGFNPFQTIQDRLNAQNSL